MVKDISRAAKSYDYDLMMARREDALNTKGCVVEALGSVTGIPLESSHRQVRAAQLLRGAETDERAFRDVVSLVERVRNDLDSRAGQALLGMQISGKAMTPKDMRAVVRSGVQVMVIIPPTDKHQGHGAKITPSDGRAFYENGGDEELHLQEGRRYRTILFR